MELKITSSSITEPVTHDEVKTFMGYPSSDTSQDSLIDTIITSAREWFESKTGLSIVSKDYKAYFDRGDCNEGWYELPISPVTGTPVVSTCGTVTTYQQKGMDIVSIMPDETYGTIGIGAIASIFYVEVTFTAGATNESANLAIMGIASAMFTDRSTSVNIAKLPFSVLSLVNSLSNNI
jgi:hypothetical protein